MKNDHTEYMINVQVDYSLLNDAAKQVIPQLIAKFAFDVSARMRLLGSNAAIKFDAMERGPPSYEWQDMDLTPKE